MVLSPDSLNTTKAHHSRQEAKGKVGSKTGTTSTYLCCYEAMRTLILSTQHILNTTALGHISTALISLK